MGLSRRRREALSFSAGESSISTWRYHAGDRGTQRPQDGPRTGRDMTGAGEAGERVAGWEPGQYIVWRLWIDVDH
jgi:hypothetical protein